MNMTCTKRKVAVQADVEHTIIRPKILMVHDITIHNSAVDLYKTNDVCGRDNKLSLS